MNLLQNYIDENIINALGWTLFHILWQGLLVGIVLFFVLRLLKNKTSNLRYFVSVASLLLIVVLSLINFSTNYDKPIEKNFEISDKHKTEYDSKIIDFSSANQDKLFKADFLSVLESNIQKLDRYFPLIINLWMLGVLFFIAKFVFSFLYTNRLKKSKIQSIQSKWKNKFTQLEHKLEINKKIKYIESKLVNVPIVLGYLKPLIIIPVGMLTSMPSNQIDAIIAHELAHIKRNDYIINVLQSLIETIFFFHPAVWYISNQIRNERENCCDDIALSVCEEKMIYAKALVSVQELKLGKLYSAVAFSGKKKHLLNRIKRMIMKPKVKSNFTDKIITALIIVSAVVALSFTYAAETNDLAEKIHFPNSIEKPSEVTEPTMPDAIQDLELNTSNLVIPEAPVAPKTVYRDTIRKYKTHRETIEIDDQTVVYKSKKNGERQEMKFTMKNGKAIDLYIDGKKIPEKDYPKYQAEVNDVIDDLKAAKDDIRDAMEDIEDLDIEKIQYEIQESMKDFHVDMAEAQKEIAEAMKTVNEVNVEEILNEVQAQINELKDIDLDFDIDLEDIYVNIDVDKIKAEIEEAQKAIRENVNMEEIRKELEAARKDMENIDMEEIQKEMERAQKELSELNIQEIQKEIQESMEHMEKVDKEEIKKELQEKLEELENLELEEK